MLALVEECITAGRLDQALRLLGDPADDREALRLRAVTLLKMGRVQESERVFDAYLAQCPPEELRDRSLEVARAFGDASENARAARHAARALEADPCHPEARERHAAYLTSAGRPSEALREARKAVGHCPDSARLWLLLAGQATDAHLSGDALQAARIGLLRKPDDSDLKMMCGVALLELLRLPEAGKVFASLPPDRSREVADAYIARDHHGLALPYLDRALQAGPPDIEAILDRLACLRALGRHEEAEAWRADSGFPPEARVADLAARGHPADAERAADAADEPITSKTYLDIAEAYRRRGREADALRVTEQALQIRRDDAVLLRSRALSLVRLGRPAEARGVLERLHQASESIEAAQLYAVAGLVDEAVQHYRAAIAENPWDPDVRRALVGLLIDHRRYPEALREVRAAIRRRPGDSGMWDLSREVHLARGWRRRALRAARRAAALEPGHIEVHRDHLTLLIELGRWRRAEAVARTVAARYVDGADLLCDVAEALDGRRADDTALRLLDEAARHNPSSMRPMAARAKVLLALHAFAEAERIVEELVSRCGGGGDALLAAAQLLSDMDRDERAAAYAARVLTRVPDHVEAYAARTRYLYYADLDDQARSTAREAVTRLPGNLALWEQLIRYGPATEAMQTAEEVLALFPPERHAEILPQLADAVESSGAAEAALALRRRVLDQEPGDPAAIVAQASQLETLGCTVEAVRLLTAATGDDASDRLARLYEDHHFYALARLAEGRHAGARSMEGTWLRRRGWLSGGPIRWLRRRILAFDQSVMGTWQSWHFNLRVLDSLEIPQDGRMLAVRAEIEAYHLRWARAEHLLSTVKDPGRRIAAVLGALAAGVAAVRMNLALPGAAVTVALVTTTLLAVIATGYRVTFLKGAMIASGCAAASMALSRAGLGAAAATAGVILLGQSSAYAARGAFVWLHGRLGSVPIKMIRRSNGRAAVLDRLFDLILRLERAGAGSSLAERRYDTWLLEQAAQGIERDLPQQLRASDAGMDLWLAERAAAAARALRRLKRQILTSGPDDLGLVRAELRRCAGAIVRGELSHLRQAKAEATLAKPGWRGRVLPVTRAVAVMGLPVLGVIAFQPLLGLDAETYRSAFLASLVWALLYLLLVLDPALRDKIETARSLLSSASTPPKPDATSEPKARSQPTD
ncbi:tetratricopeptide repeat protein [Sphaerisporangium viridialbum]|uniref:tetratricopeptide repeat protein n=1 Tax=Sphaerisporangium viridialbum TaxID=46189 RepID=UPI003C7841D0